MNWCGKWVITCTAQYMASPHQAGGMLAEWISRGCCCSLCSQSEEEIVFLLGVAGWSLIPLSTFWTELEEKLFRTHSLPSPTCSTPYSSGYTLSGCSVGGILATVILIFLAFILALWYYVGKGNGVPFSLHVLQKACSHGEHSKLVVGSRSQEPCSSDSDPKFMAPKPTSGGSPLLPMYVTSCYPADNIGIGSDVCSSACQRWAPVFTSIFCSSSF